MRLTARSSDYRTPPWGFKYQPPFINLCIAVETTLSPRDLLAHAQAVELQLGRDRAHEKRWGPRTADIDIIAYGDLAVDELGLTVPHPRLFERAFVLLPLAEIAPDLVIDGRTRAGGRCRRRYRRNRAAAAATMTGTVFANPCLSSMASTALTMAICADD